MAVKDILNGIELWCTKCKDSSEYSYGFYKGSLNALQAVGLISDDTYYKYARMLNDKFTDKR